MVNGVSLTSVQDLDFALGIVKRDRWEYSLQQLLPLRPGLSVFDCLLIVSFWLFCWLSLLTDFGRPNHWPTSRASGLTRDTMISVSGNDGFEDCVEQILSYPMRIVKNLSCIESLNVHAHSWNLRLHGFVTIMLCFCFLRISCSAGVHRTPFICLVIYGILLVPWHVVNFQQSGLRFPWTIYISNFILQAVMSKAHGCNVVLSLSSLVQKWKSAVDALKDFFDGQMEQKLCIIIFKLLVWLKGSNSVRWQMSHDGSWIFNPGPLRNENAFQKDAAKMRSFWKLWRLPWRSCWMRWTCPILCTSPY